MSKWVNLVIDYKYFARIINLPEGHKITHYFNGENVDAMVLRVECPDDSKVGTTGVKGEQIPIYYPKYIQRTTVEMEWEDLK